jgi:hypothetical protein
MSVVATQAESGKRCDAERDVCHIHAVTRRKRWEGELGRKGADALCIYISVKLRRVVYNSTKRRAVAVASESHSRKRK